MDKFINLTVIKLNTHCNWYSRDEVFGHQIREIRKNNTEFKECEGWTIVLDDSANIRFDASEISLEDYRRHPQFVNTFVAIDDIVQIETDHETLVVFKRQNAFDEYKIVPIYRLTVKTGRGRGINGIDHDMYITQESYSALISKIFS